MGTYYASRFARTDGDVFVLHNGVTWFNAAVSNLVQKSSADRSSGGISADLVDARQSSSLRTFSNQTRKLVVLEVIVEQRINKIDTWRYQ